MGLGEGANVFTLTIETDNAAFGEPGSTEQADEIGRILRAVAGQVEDESPAERGVYDANGNRVGTWRLE